MLPCAVDMVLLCLMTLQQAYQIPFLSPTIPSAGTFMMCQRTCQSSLMKGAWQPLYSLDGWSCCQQLRLQNTVSPCMKADIAALQKDFQRYFLIQHPKEYDWMCDPGSRTPPMGVASGSTMEDGVSVKDTGCILDFSRERLHTARYESPGHAPDQSWSLKINSE